MNQTYQPLHHKYRPEKFDDVIGQSAITITLKQALKTNRIAPAYLFSGPRGTGKTSSARILARSLNCLNSKVPTAEPCGECNTCITISNGTSLDVIEIDAASNTGVENIRELIERSRFAPVQSRWKVYVIDECHMLSTAAFNALLKTLEEPPPNVVFVLATTDPQRVLPTILSRCQRFDFQRIPINDLISHLKMISSKEEILIEKEALEIIAQRAQGGLRDAESMLDQLSLVDPPIKSRNVWDLIGAIPEEELLSITSSLIAAEPIKLLESCRTLLEHGREPINILQGIASTLRDLIVVSIAPEKEELLNISNESKDQLKDLSKSSNLQELLKLQANLKGSENNIRNSMQPRLWLEVLLLGILAKDTNANNINPDIIKQRKVKNEDRTGTLREQNSSINLTDKESSPSELKTSLQEENLNKELNLDELWQEILGSLELPSTRMLLTQQAKLSRLNKEKAVIKVSENWLGMVQSRIGLLTQAIEKTLGSKREVLIESHMEPTMKQEKIEQKTNTQKETKYINDEPKRINTQKPILKSEKDLIKKEINHERESSQENFSDKQKSIDNNAKILADFFNGEIL